MNVKKQISDFFVERNVSLGDNFVQLHLYTHDKLPEINPCICTRMTSCPR